MIPTRELSAMQALVADAWIRADKGDIEEGYLRLLAGMQAARQAGEAGEPWAAELVQRFQEAQNDFAQQWGVGRG